MGPGLVQVEILGGRHIEAQNLSATGAQLLLDDSSRLGDLVRVRLRTGDRAAEADLHVVRRSSLGAGQVEIGARFGELSSEAMRLISMAAMRELSARADDLSRLLGADTAIRTYDEGYIRRLLHLNGVIERRPFSAFEGHIRVSSFIQLRALATEGGETHLRMKAAKVPLRSGSSYRFLVPGVNAVAVFETTVLANDGAEITVQMPREILQTGFRESHRALLAPSEGARVSFRHPRLVGVTLSRPLLDVAARGLSFLFDPAEDFLFPEDKLTDVTVRLPEGQLTVEGIVRRMVADPTNETFICGIQITGFAGARDRERWQGEVFRRTHPNLRHSDAGHVDTLWNVLRQSKYVDLWTPPPLRDYLHKQFLRVWGSAEPPSSHAFLVKHVDSERGENESLIGTMAATLIYPHTSMIHHLGIDERARKAEQKPQLFGYLRELFSGVLYGLRYRAEANYLLFYIDADSRFNKLLYSEFVKRVSDTGDLIYDHLQVFRCSADDQGPEGEANPRIQVAPADRAFLDALSEHLQHKLPDHEFRSYSFDKANIDLRDFSERCDRFGYERARHVFAATERGVPLAALVAESGEEGINLFGLMNTASVVELSPGGARRALPALVATARKHYRRLGKQQFLFLQYGSVADPALPTLGLRFISAGIRWLSHLRVTPAWMAYLEEICRQRGSHVEAPSA